MHELRDFEIAAVSGGRPVGFFCSYVLEQNNYNFFSCIGIGTLIGMACSLSSLPQITPPIIYNALTYNLVTSLSGYMIGLLVCPPAKVLVP